jgi:hypothetical protein
MAPLSSIGLPSTTRQGTCALPVIPASLSLAPSTS